MENGNVYSVVVARSGHQVDVLEGDDPGLAAHLGDGDLELDFAHVADPHLDGQAQVVEDVLAKRHIFQLHLACKIWKQF